ncbi:MAG: hypothetical protein WCS42_04910 [Verrucomicrobiota bacterium]
MKRNSFNIGEVHAFSRQLAKEHGIPAAILLAFLAHRIKSVEEARKDQRGYFTSVKVMAKHYPYLTPSIISYALTKLRKKEVLLTDSHNRKAYDRTLWYRFADPKVQQLALEDPIRFNVEIATRSGVEAAVILQNLDYWIRENQKTDNRYIWHRVSPPEMAKHVPLSERTIRRVLEQLFKDHVLDRKPASGYDQAYLYCFFSASVHERSIYNYERSNSEMHRSDSQMDRPNSEIERPKPATNTLCEDTIGKTSLVKTPLKEPVEDTLAAPKFVSSLHHCGFAGTNGSSAPRISASGQDTGRTAMKLKANEISAPSTQVLPERIRFGTLPWLQASAEAYQRYDVRCQQYRSPYENLENDPSLTAEQKTRVFKQAIVSMRKIGSPEGEPSSQIIHSGKTFETARKFFDLNPEVSVSDVTCTIETCKMMALMNPKPDEGYDEFFYMRRVHNLDFFFKHLSKLGGFDTGNLLDGCACLDDDLDAEIRSEPVLH